MGKKCKYHEKDRCPTYNNIPKIKKLYCDPTICGNFIPEENSKLVELTEDSHKN